MSKAIKEGRLTLTAEGKIDTEPAKKTATGGALPSYSESRSARAAFEARLKRLEYEQKRGELINASEAAQAWSDIAGRLRDELLAIPDRIALKVEQKPAREIREVLMTEIRRALLVIADEVRAA